MRNRRGALFAIAVLFAINAMNFYDRQILGVLGEQISREWKLSDTALGGLGTAFTLLYAAVGIPFGRLADKRARTQILSVGVFLWTVFTAASGIVSNYAQMFAVRLGVGVGEASCAPAATSLIGDLFPPARRARALAVFMLGLPIGIAASSAVSGWVTQRSGWRTAFFVAAVPGLICAFAALFVTEPPRGATEVHDIGGHKRAGSPYRLVLSIPTMWWLILSGALHNFNMYALGGFLSPLLQRFYSMTVQDAGYVTMLVYGLCGVPGLLLGGFFGDKLMKRRSNGRLLLATVAVSISAPLVFLALVLPKGHTPVFMLLMGTGIGFMYVYYATVYSTVQDIIEPSLRGTAMALYFFAMYVLGAAGGTLVIGIVSDHFIRGAATAAGVTQFTTETLRQFRGQGLHSAMYIIPVLIVFLALVLYGASRTVTKDMERLHNWMREAAARQLAPLLQATEAKAEASGAGATVD
jgi:MFS family permease